MGKLIRKIVALFGAAIGLAAALLLNDLKVFAKFSDPWPIVIQVIIVIAFIILFYFLGPFIVKNIKKGQDNLLRYFDGVPLNEVLIATGGLVIGLLIAMLVSSPVLSLSLDYLGNSIGVILAIILYLFFGILGLRLALNHKEDIMEIFNNIFDPARRSERKKNRKHRKDEDEEGEEQFVFEGTRGVKEQKVIPKILDTSVIIDGRIFEIIKTGFLQGPLILSHYVLEELQHISDSADTLRRNRGRKGLDCLQNMQKNSDIEVIVDNSNITRVKEVDSKLLVLTKKYKGKIITNDYNLNKVAAVQDIDVLNVNDLANAIKPIVIPGEHLEVFVLKEGKEAGQGLAYLDDGTMIVVEDGREAIGKTVDTVVTSVLQTSAGKMIFTRIHPLF